MKNRRSLIVHKNIITQKIQKSFRNSKTFLPVKGMDLNFLLTLIK